MTGAVGPDAHEKLSTNTHAPHKELPQGIIGAPHSNERVYRSNDGGNCQLEDLLDKEVAFLNDFAYDAGAKDWMPWLYFKYFLEGGETKVARPTKPPQS